MNIDIRYYLSVLMMTGSLLLGSQVWATTGHDKALESAPHCDSTKGADQSKPCHHSSTGKEQPKATMDHSQHAMPMDMNHMDHSQMHMPAATPDDHSNH